MPKDPEPDPKPKEADADKHDVVLVHGQTEDGEGVRVLRSRPGKIEAAELRAIKQGVPIQGAEVVRLRERDGSPVLWDVEVEYDGRDEASHKGPSRVSSRAYRDNWDRIFGDSSAGDVN
ncbi:MAG: hypothetical protein HY898_27205 [Deltaproteobacteria bacterium]|nr:hypothetical protein [Deltaproteobacteria bacterium]